MNASSRILARVLSVFLLAVLLAGCAGGIPRVAYTEADQMGATVFGMPADIRAWADAPAEAFLPGLRDISRYAEARGSGPKLLALSGGADDGAYGAGFLVGWSERGDRPEFALVSGISTGALIAPFAFLGPAYDGPLREVFTQIDASNVFQFVGLGGLFGPGLADTGPLREMVAKHVTPSFLAEIAAEHRKGRRLIVVTTNLDAQRSVVWNMGRIAEIGTPRALELFRDVLVASASVPAVFPPVLIDVESEGLRYHELHVDGGATLQVFTLPNAVLVSGAARRSPPGTSIYMIINNRLFPDFEVVRATTIRVAARSLSTIVKSSALQTVAQTYEFARSRGIDFFLTYIGEDFEQEYEGPFNREYMNALFEYGYARGRSGDGFLRSLPFDPD